MGGEPTGVSGKGGGQGGCWFSRGGKAVGVHVGLPGCRSVRAQGEVAPDAAGAWLTPTWRGCRRCPCPALCHRQWCCLKQHLLVSVMRPSVGRWPRHHPLPTRGLHDPVPHPAGAGGHPAAVPGVRHRAEAAQGQRGRLERHPPRSEGCRCVSVWPGGPSGASPLCHQLLLGKGKSQDSTPEAFANPSLESHRQEGCRVQARATAGRP